MKVAFDAPTRRRFAVSKAVFALGLLLFLVILVGLAGTAFVRWLSEGFTIGFMSGFGLVTAEEKPAWTYPLLAVTGFVVLPSVVFMPVLVPLALTWRNPRRIVVFRRFHTKLENKALRRIALSYLSPYGHVFTLADSQIHRSWFVRMPFLLGQLNFFNFRLRRVHDAKGMMKLHRVLERRWQLNLNWLLTPRKIFPIHTSDEYWKRCVSLLLDEADLIVMEASQFSAAMTWEIEECERRGLLDKTVLLMRDVSPEADEKRNKDLESVIGTGAVSVFRYNNAELDAPAEWHDRVSGILANSKKEESRLSRWHVLPTVAANMALGVTMAAVTLAMTAPYVLPESTARHSPLHSQVMTAYLREGDMAYLEPLVKQDWSWIHDGLRRSVMNGPEFERRNAVMAIGRWGDQGDIPLLVAEISRFNNGRSDKDRLQGYVRWFKGYPQEALVTLLQRLGRPALPSLFEVIETTPVMPFDLDLYSDLYLGYIQPNSSAADDPLFMKLLGCPNQTGRFIAAEHLGYRRDRRAVPALRELAQAATPGLLGWDAEDMANRLEAAANP